MRTQGGSIIQQLRAETGACIKVLEEVVSMPGTSPGVRVRPAVDLRVVVISQPASRFLPASITALVLPLVVDCQDLEHEPKHHHESVLWLNMRPGHLPGRRDDDRRCSMEAATLAVLSRMFAAADAAPPARGQPVHATLAAQQSIAPAHVAANSNRTAADGTAHGGDHKPERTDVTAADCRNSPDLALRQAGRIASTGTATPSAFDAQCGMADPDFASRTVEVCLLVTHFTAGLLVGSASGSGEATHARVVGLPGRRDDTAFIVSGCLSTVKQQVATIAGASVSLPSAVQW